MGEIYEVALVEKISEAYSPDPFISSHASGKLMYP